MQVADKNLADNYDKTALINASESGHIEVVSLLLGAGADKNSEDLIGNTALLVKATLKSFDCCWMQVPTRLWQTTGTRLL